MTYFQYTGQDLRKARDEATSEIGNLILALADDTRRKMNGESATDPDAEIEYDEGYLQEDLLARLHELAVRFGAEPDLFPDLRDSYGRHVHAYPLFEQENAPIKAKAFVPAPATMRPHEFEAAYTPGTCTALYTDADGYGADCGLPADHPIHVTGEVTQDLGKIIPLRQIGN